MGFNSDFLIAKASNFVASLFEITVRAMLLPFLLLLQLLPCPKKT